jgi:predicted DNA-binding protein
MQSKQGKQRRNRRSPIWRTVRVSAETRERIDVIAKGLDRPHSWVVQEAVAAYRIVEDLKDAGRPAKPRLVVRA